MPTKRRTPKRAEHAITPEAVAAYRAGDAMRLHRLLGLKPWMESPLRAIGECPWPAGSGGEATWPLIVALRSELETADAS